MWSIVRFKSRVTCVCGGRNEEFYILSQIILSNNIFHLNFELIICAAKRKQLIFEARSTRMGIC